MVISIEVKGEQLQKWREDHGLTREELARELRTSYPTIYRWEKNQREIPPYLELALERLAQLIKPIDQ